jgi:hypothetical protein
MARRPRSNCPDYPENCRAADPPQRHLTEGEQNQLTGRAAEFARGAEICSYCGLVYTRFPEMRRLGHLNNALVGAGFRPARGYD